MLYVIVICYPYGKHRVLKVKGNMELPVRPIKGDRICVSDNILKLIRKEEEAFDPKYWGPEPHGWPSPIFEVKYVTVGECIVIVECSELMD